MKCADFSFSFLFFPFVLWGSKQYYVPVGYKVNVDSGSMLGTNRKIVVETRASKQIEFDKKPEIKEIRKQCHAEEVRNIIVRSLSQFLYVYISLIYWKSKVVHMEKD